MKHKFRRSLLYPFARLISFLVYPLPLRIATKIGALVATCAFYLVSKERKRTLAHLKMAFGNEKPDKELRGIALRVFQNLGRNAVEWISFPKLSQGWFDKNITNVGVENLDIARKRGKGTIVLASHFGNWELLSANLNHLGCFGILVVRKIYIEKFDRYFTRLRMLWGNRVVDRNDPPKQVLKELKGNGYIGILADQDVASVEGVFVDFFGMPAYTPVGPVKIAMASGAALIPMFMIREGGRFRFIIEKAVEMERTDDRERDVLVNTIKWSRVIEKYIRRYPDHWVWMHRRWKTKPKTVTSRQMQLIDTIAQERFGIPSIKLMENAGSAAGLRVLHILKRNHTIKNSRVAVICGKGNNGGDGFVVSRKLMEKKVDVTTYLLYPEDELKKDPSKNHALLKELGGKIVSLGEGSSEESIIDELSGYGVVVDAIFGTGFKGSPNSYISRVISSINRSGAVIVSIDLPSGLDASTGRCEGECVMAGETVTFGIPKIGFYQNDGPRHAGKISVKNIGFPDELLKDPPL